MMTLLGLALLAGGCTGQGDQRQDSVGGTDSSTLPTDDSATGSTVERSASMEGTVVDGVGSPVAGADLRLCRGPACRNSETDITGAYGFDEVHVDWHAFEIKPPADSGRLATAFAPLLFGAEERRTIRVVLPTLDDPTPLTGASTEIEVGAGLLLTLDDTTLEPPLFNEPAVEVAGILLDTGDQMPVDLAGTIIAMWYLEPFDHEATQGVPLRITNRWGLPDGNSYKVLVGSYGTSEWIDAGSLQVDGATLEGSASLPKFSTVILLED